VDKNNYDDSYENSVFINCPFDPDYNHLLRASLFTILACGFYPITALQENDGGNRMEKIVKQIKGCKYSIHDLSMIELDDKSKLPRFNMPFELGIDFGLRWSDNEKYKGKNFLIFESSAHQLGVYLSDLAGCDPTCHIRKPTNAIAAIRKWLNTAELLKGTYCLPGEKKINETFENYCQDLPDICRKLDIEYELISYADLLYSMKTYIKRFPGLINPSVLE